jgi:hypothetical protein
MKIALLVLFLLVSTISVAAAGLNPVSPAEGATIDPKENEFSFSTMSDLVVASCTLYIDGHPLKNVTYKDSIRSRTINYAVSVEDGEHTWQAKCDAGSQILDTPVRKFKAFTPKDTNVKVTPSGVFRGSFMHAFDFSNTPTQEPVTLSKIAPGDFIDISLLLPPSKLNKELYVKQISAKNDKKYLLVEDSKLRASYYLYQGQNVSINISSSHVIMNFIGSENNKAIIVVYSSFVTQPPTSEVPAVEEAPPVPTPVVEEPPKQVARPIINTTEPQAPSAPKQSGFKRFISWLSSIFG